MTMTNFHFNFTESTWELSFVEEWGIHKNSYCTSEFNRVPKFMVGLQYPYSGVSANNAASHLCAMAMRTGTAHQKQAQTNQEKGGEGDTGATSIILTQMQNVAANDGNVNRVKL